MQQLEHFKVTQATTKLQVINNAITVAFIKKIEIQEHFRTGMYIAAHSC